MAKFFLGLLAGILLAFLALIIFAVAAARLREAPPHIADGSVLVLRLAGDIPERPPLEFPFDLLGRSREPTMANLWMMLRKAAADARIRAIVLEPHALSLGWGKLEEIRAGLERFRQSGKPVYAFLRSPGGREYYLATAASRVYLGPQDVLYLKGMRAEAMFFKGTLDKLGVEVQIEHAGKYKDFGDMFTRTDMSAPTREVLNSVLDGLYGNLVERIAAGRRKSPGEVRALIDRGPFLAEQARAAGLVDELRFEDQVFGELQTALKARQLNRVGISTYLRVPARSLGLTGKQRIALVVAEGSISGGDPAGGVLEEEGLTSSAFVRLLRRVRADAQLKGVILRIDSPGGEVTASDEIWREMNLLGKAKPLVISMSDVAASGGYYMAMTGDPIVAYPGTYTGSIGVVFGKPTLRGLYNKIGITKDAISRGRFANIDSDYVPLGPAELAKLDEGIQASYRDFVAKVAQARRRSVQQIDELAQGRVWLGMQARPALVDELGGFDRALEIVKKKAGIPAAEKVTLVSYPPRRSLLDLLFRQPAEAVLQAQLGSAFRTARQYLRVRPGLLRIMPFALDVR